MQKLERELGEAKWRLDVENAAMDDLQAEVDGKGSQLQASQAQVAELIDQI